MDVDLVIDQALNGDIDEDSVVQATGLQSFVVDDLKSDQSHVRRNMDDQDAYDFLESNYDTESVIREDYLQDIGEAQDLVEEGIAEIR